MFRAEGRGRIQAHFRRPALLRGRPAPRIIRPPAPPRKTFSLPLSTHAPPEPPFTPSERTSTPSEACFALFGQTFALSERAFTPSEEAFAPNGEGFTLSERAIRLSERPQILSKQLFCLDLGLSGRIHGRESFDSEQLRLLLIQDQRLHPLQRRFPPRIPTPHTARPRARPPDARTRPPRHSPPTLNAGVPRGAHPRTPMRNRRLKCP